jgi:hypothetical protein
MGASRVREAKSGPLDRLGPASDKAAVMSGRWGADLVPVLVDPLGGPVPAAGVPRKQATPGGQGMSFR